MNQTRARSQRDREILAALLDGHSQRKTAELVGCGRSSVSRRLARPDFVALLEREERRMLADVRRRCIVASDTALATLEAMATDDKVPPAVREAACRDILAFEGRLRPRVVEADVTTHTTAPASEPSGETLRESLDRIARNWALTEPGAAVTAGNGAGANGHGYNGNGHRNGHSNGGTT